MLRNKKCWYGLAAAVFWLAVWEVLAHVLDLSFAIPTVEATAAALWRLIQTALFWQTIAYSLGRIVLGCLLGTVLGVVLALVSVTSDFADALISPVQTMIRCTPVASFIMVLWILAGRDAVPIAIALLMVMPVIWQAVRDGYRGLDKTLSEVVSSFHASPLQWLTMFVLPSLKECFLTAFVTAVGLAWKAGVAAEIITYTANSIGRSIADARNLFDGPAMMAWTVCVVLLSLCMEKGMRRLLKNK